MIVATFLFLDRQQHRQAQGRRIPGKACMAQEPDGAGHRLGLLFSEGLG
jgi:hypothetical protein